MSKGSPFCSAPVEMGGEVNSDVNEEMRPGLTHMKKMP